MTLRYIQVTQNDLQREYHQARQNMGNLHAIPEPPIPSSKAETPGGITAITKSLAAINHLLEMYRRQLSDEKPRRKLDRLANRLVKIAAEIDRLGTASNEQRLAGQCFLSALTATLCVPKPASSGLT